MPTWAVSSLQKVLQLLREGPGSPNGSAGIPSATLLSECGNDVKVVQELMRHAKLSTTMEIYTHPRMERKRETQSHVVDVPFWGTGRA